MSLHRRYLCKFPTASMFPSATSLTVAYNLLMMMIIIIIGSCEKNKKTYQSRWKMIPSHHSAFFVISKSVLAYQIHRNCHSNYRLHRRSCKTQNISGAGAGIFQGPPLLTWINFNPSMGKLLHPLSSVR